MIKLTFHKQRKARQFPINAFAELTFTHLSIKNTIKVFAPSHLPLLIIFLRIHCTPRMEWCGQKQRKRTIANKLHLATQSCTPGDWPSHTCCNAKTDIFRLHKLYTVTPDWRESRSYRLAKRNAALMLAEAKSGVGRVRQGHTERLAGGFEDILFGGENTPQFHWHALPRGSNKVN